MDPILGTILTQAGIQLVGGITGKLFGGEEELQDRPWGAMRASYAAELQDILGGQKEKAFGVARREATRTGTALGGAYLESVTQIEQQISDIFGREMSQFEMKQMEMQAQWGMEQAKVKYAESAQARQETQGMVGNIFGTLAAYPKMKYQAERQKELTGKFETAMGKIPEIKPVTAETNWMNSLLRLQYFKLLGFNSPAMETQMQTLINTLYKGNDGSLIGPSSLP